MKKIISILIVLFTVTITVNSAEVPADAKLDYNQGIDFYKLGMYERAIESFRSAIRTYPDYIDAYYNLGTVLEYLRNYSEANNIFKQLYMRNPNDYEVIYKLANLSVKLEDYDSALKYINLIPFSSEYYKQANELTAEIKKQIQVPDRPANQPSKIATQTGVYENILSPTGITSDSLGNIYIAVFSENSIIKVSPDNKRTVFVKSDKISGPISLASDSIGNIYLSNYNANNVLKIDPLGAVTVLVENLNKPYGLHVDGDMLFITCQGSNSVYRQKLSK